MKVNINKERNSLKNERDKLLRRKDLKSEDKSLKREETSRLTSLNSDIEKLLKKYSEIKKERITKEKNQQILVNRLNYLRNEVRRSVSKKGNQPKNIKKSIENKKIFVKINSKYKFNRVVKRYKESDNHNSHNNELFKDNESLGKTSFNGNESQIIYSGNYKSFANSKKKGYNNSNINLSKEKENENNDSHNDLNKNNISNLEEDFLRKYKYNIGNKNSNNNIYIIINNPNNNFFKEKSLNLDNKNNFYIDKFTPKNNNIKYEKNNHIKYKSYNNIDFREEGEIILMNANGKKLQDIINSINNLNNLKSNKNKTKEKKFENNDEKDEKDEKEKNNDKINNNIKDNGDISNKSNNINEIKKKDSFIRPNFLNLYENDDNSEMKQKVDINSFGETNRTENCKIKGGESNEIIKDNNIFEDDKKKLNKESKNNISNNNFNSQNKMSNNPFNSGISTISNGSSGVKQINTKKQIINIDKNKCLLNELNKFEDITKNNLILNNTISVDNFEYYKLYSSNSTTDEKEKNSTINNDPKEFSIKESTENNYYLLNKNNKISMMNVKKTDFKNNIKKIGNSCINYSLSYKNLNNSYRNKDISKIRKNNTKLNIDLEKIKKNYIRKDSYYTSIEKKRKALGIEFKSNFNRELSIQTEKVTKKKVLGKRKNNNILINDNCVKSMNIYENLINKEKKEKLIKVKKRDGNEDRFNFENKIMDNESYYHKMKKNKTTTRFNYTKSSINSQNNKKEGLNENILRNKKIKKKNNNIFFLDNNDKSINKTSDSCFYSLVNKIINGN